MGTQHNISFDGVHCFVLLMIVNPFPTRVGGWGVPGPGRLGSGLGEGDQCGGWVGVGALDFLCAQIICFVVT